MAGKIDPALQTALLAAVEAGLNRALQLSQAGRHDLAELQECVFALHCTSPAMDVYVQPGAERVRLMGTYEGPVTTSVRGSASAFAEVLTAADTTAALINGELELEGDSGPLVRLQQIVAGLEMDWEAPLVETFGDVAGHQLAQSLRAAYGWGSQASTSLARQVGEFIHEEARLCPSGLELEDFYRDVRELSLRVERLESRIRRARKRLLALQQH